MMNLDLVVFGVYLAVVAGVGFFVSRRQERETDDYFLAGRGLAWWVIGGSLIAANISTHHFIGMSGQGFTIGLAIASYEWMAALALILYGRFFLPYYLKTRITTMPEFLESRFNGQVRLVFAVICLVGYIFIELAVVLYTGSLAIQSIFGLPLVYGLLILCVIGGGYTIYGGLRSVAFTDVIQVTVLIVGGLVVTFIGLIKVGVASPGYSPTFWGGFQALMDSSPEKFHMVQPWNHPNVPWIGVFFGGMWLANIFYRGCNQFITQRTLTARSVWDGQMGVVFAGFLKLLVPILVVPPGIIAFKLYDQDSGLLRQEFSLAKGDLAFPTLVSQLLPRGFTGLVVAGLIGAVMSTIASLLASSSSVLTFDVYKRCIRQHASPAELIRVGRYTTFIVLIVATAVGYFLQDLPAIFRYIQEYWSIAYPSIAAVFLAGFFYRRANAQGSIAALILGPVWAGLFTAAQKAGWAPQFAFLIRAGCDFLFCCLIIWMLRTRGPVLDKKTIVDRSVSPELAAEMARVPFLLSFRFWAAMLILSVASLYCLFF